MKMTDISAADVDAIKGSSLIKNQDAVKVSQDGTKGLVVVNFGDKTHKDVVNELAAVCPEEVIKALRPKLRGAFAQDGKRIEITLTEYVNGIATGSGKKLTKATVADWADAIQKAVAAGDMKEVTRISAIMAEMSEKQKKKK